MYRQGELHAQPEERQVPRWDRAGSTQWEHVAQKLGRGDGRGGQKAESGQMSYSVLYKARWRQGAPKQSIQYFPLYLQHGAKASESESALHRGRVGVQPGAWGCILSKLHPRGQEVPAEGDPSESIEPALVNSPPRPETLIMITFKTHLAITAIHY